MRKADRHGLNDAAAAAGRASACRRLYRFPAHVSGPAFSVPFFRTPAAQRDRGQDYLIELRVVPSPGLGQCAVHHRHEVQVLRLRLKRVEAINHLAHQPAHLFVSDPRHLRPGNSSTVRVDHYDIGEVPGSADRLDPSMDVLKHRVGRTSSTSTSRCSRSGAARAHSPSASTFGVPQRHSFPWRCAPFDQVRGPAPPMRSLASTQDYS